MAAPHGSGTVYKESSPTRKTKWRAEKIVRLPTGGRRRLVARGVTQKEALHKLAIKERAALRSHPDAAKLTVRSFLEERWLKSKRGAVRPSTLAEYERIVALVVKECGFIPLAHVNTEHLQEAVNAAVEREELGTATAIRRYMRGAFKHAVMTDLLAKNPAEGIPRIYRPDPVRLKWEPAEAERFLRAAREHAHAGYESLFMTALLTGMRKGELIALRWADVRPTSVLVRSSASRHAAGGVGATKTPKGHRRVPITEGAYETISELRGRMPRSEWAFPSEVGTRLGERNVLRVFHRIIDATAKPDADPPLETVTRIRFHDLRRTTATWWAAAGVPPKVIQRLLGHATTRLALEIYNDVLDGQVESAALDPARWLGGGSIGGSDD